MAAKLAADGRWPVGTAGMPDETLGGNVLGVTVVGGTTEWADRVDWLVLFGG